MKTPIKIVSICAGNGWTVNLVDKNERRPVIAWAVDEQNDLHPFIQDPTGRAGILLLNANGGKFGDPKFGP